MPAQIGTRPVTGFHPGKEKSQTKGGGQHDRVAVPDEDVSQAGLHDGHSIPPLG